MRGLMLGPLALVVACAAAPPALAPVPENPTDSIPAWVYADGNLLTTQEFASARVPRNVVMVGFRQGVSSSLKQAAFDSVQGELIGGVSLAGGGGMYLVRIKGDRTGARLRQAITVLERLPQVLGAGIAVLGISNDP